jgi:hypothetical protein
MKHVTTLTIAASVVALSMSTLTATSLEAAGRYKKEGQRCVWDPNDSGPNQCTPPSGRYKKVGTKCVWDAKDSGEDQCTPPKGRFKKEGDRCVWDANDSGVDQCRPIAQSKGR